MEVIRTDCLVIGGGFAGASYALYAARAGLDVQLLSLGGPLEANSNWAQGGIIFDASSDPEPLMKDIIEASAGTANPAAVRQLAMEGPAAIQELLIDDLEVEFEAFLEVALRRMGRHCEISEFHGVLPLCVVLGGVVLPRNIERNRQTACVKLAQAFASGGGRRRPASARPVM